MTAIEREGVDQILAGTSSSVSASFTVDGVVTDPGAVTLTITRLDGTALVSDAATSGTGATARTYTLGPAQTETLDLLRLEWTGTVGAQVQTVTTYAEIVGDLLFTLKQARAFDIQQLASSGTYPDADILTARARILNAFGEICGVAFVPRLAVDLVDGDWTNTLILSHRFCSTLRMVEQFDEETDTWTAFSAAELADCTLADSGVLKRRTLGSFDGGLRNIRVSYEHGYSRVPLDIQQAALWLLISEMVPSDMPVRALSQTTDLGTFRLATAGERGAWFGIPVVDATLDRYRLKRRQGIR